MSEEINSESRPKFKILIDIIYKRQIILKSVQFIGLIYIVYGIFVGFTNVCLNLDKKAFHNNELRIFWDPLAFIYSVANCLVFAITIYYKYWNSHIGFSKLIAVPVDYMIVCFILMPLFFLSVFHLAIETLRDIIIIPCHGYFSFLIPLSTLLLFFGAVVLIFDVGQNVPRTSSWKMYQLKTNAFFFTVIGLSNYFIICFFFQHMVIFRKESRNAYNESFMLNDTCIANYPIRKSMNKTYKSCDWYLRPTILLFCVCSFAYLLQPLMQNDKVIRMIEFETLPDEPLVSELNSLSNITLYGSIETVPSEPVVNSEMKLINDHQTIANNEQSPSFRLPSGALVLCIIFLSLSFLSVIIRLSIRSDKPNLKFIGGLISTTFPIIIYILGSILSLVHIEEICRWPIYFNRPGKIIEKCLVWIGAAGQLIVAITTIAISVGLLINPTITGRHFVSQNVLLIPKNMLIMLQTYLQTILISLAIDRKWVRPDVNSWAEFLCPSVGMMGLNVGLLFLDISEMNIFISQDDLGFLFLNLLITGLKSIGGTLATLQRLHASIFFASMIIYTHN